MTCVVMATLKNAIFVKMCQNWSTFKGCHCIIIPQAEILVVSNDWASLYLYYDVSWSEIDSGLHYFQELWKYPRLWIMSDSCKSENPWKVAIFQWPGNSVNHRQLYQIIYQIKDKELLYHIWCTWFASVEAVKSWPILANFHKTRICHGCHSYTCRILTKVVA